MVEFINLIIPMPFVFFRKDKGLAEQRSHQEPALQLNIDGPK